MSAQQKEDRLFENIYLSYFPKMKRFAQEYVISEQDAENIVQDMFAELWEKREMFTCQTIRIAYLFTIIKNKCLNHLRHKTIALETINNMQEEYNMTLRMNLDSFFNISGTAGDNQNLRVRMRFTSGQDTLETELALKKNVNQMIYADLGNWKGKSKNRSPPN